MKRPYVQFSKKIVVAVFIMVTLLSLAGMIFAFMIGDAQQTTNVIRVYVQYAIVVFAAYSGNSAVEKWLVNKYSVGSNCTDDDDAQG